MTPDEAIEIVAPSTFLVDLFVIDPPSSAVTFAASNVPSFATMTTDALQLKPAYEDAGDYAIDVTATSGGEQATGTLLFHITANSGPSLQGSYFSDGNGDHPPYPQLRAAVCDRDHDNFTLEVAVGLVDAPLAYVPAFTHVVDFAVTEPRTYPENPEIGWCADIVMDLPGLAPGDYHGAIRAIDANGTVDELGWVPVTTEGSFHVNGPTQWTNPATLSAEPAPPVGSPCSGQLGFPGRPIPAPRYYVSSFDAPKFDIADVTGDGTLDVALDGEVLVGNGNGTYTSLALPLRGATRIADINNDGKPDLVTRPSPDLQILLNNGAGGFAQTPTTVDVGGYAEAFQVVDVNNDRRRDVITFSAGPQIYVTLALKNGSGFATPVVYPIPDLYPSTADFAVGDISGDGSPDVVTISADGLVYVQLNNGNGTFGTATSYSTVDEPVRVRIGDLNEDGKGDVIVAKGGSGQPQLAIHLSQGNGVLSTSTVIVLGTYIQPLFMELGDINSDGHLDLVAGRDAYPDGATDNVLLLGTGTGTFSTPTVLASDGARWAKLGDVDGDGDRDLLTFSDTGLSTYLNAGTAPFFDQRKTINYGLSVRSARLMDINNDGAADLIVGLMNPSTGASSITTRLATSGGFASATTSYVGPYNPTWLVPSDLDNDGDQDVVAVGETATLVFMNDEAGALRFRPFYYSGASGALEGDFDGDGRRDIILANGTQIDLYHGDGYGKLAPPHAIWNRPNTLVYSIGKADLDGDEHPELLVSLYDHSTSSTVVDVVRSNGNGTFAAPIPGAFPTSPVDYTLSSEHGDKAIADLNGDGNLDAIWAGSNRVRVTLGNADGTFQTALDYEAYGPATSVSVADINNDGRLDLVVNNGNELNLLYGRCLP